MKSILDEVDRQINATLNNQGVKAYGLCKQAIKSDQVHPVTWDEQKQVAVNDKYLCAYFHRLLDDILSEDIEEFAFGRSYKARHNHKVRTVVIVKHNKQQVQDDWIDKFIDAIPLQITIDGFKFINLSQDMNKIVDFDGVYKAEFGDDEYEKRILPYYVYALEWTVDYMTC